MLLWISFFIPSLSCANSRHVQSFFSPVQQNNYRSQVSNQQFSLNQWMASIEVIHVYSMGECHGCPGIISVSGIILLHVTCIRYCRCTTYTSCSRCTSCTSCSSCSRCSHCSSSNSRGSCSSCCSCSRRSGCSRCSSCTRTGCT